MPKTIKREADDQDVGNRAEDCVDNDVQRVGHKVPAVEGEGGVENDRWEKDVEEEVGSELEHGVLLRPARPDQGTHHDSQDDEEARLREAVEDGDLVVVDVDQDPEDHGECDTDVPFVVCPSEGYEVDPTVTTVIVCAIVIVYTTLIVCSLVIVFSLVIVCVMTIVSALVIVCAMPIVCGKHCWMCISGSGSLWQICKGKEKDHNREEEETHRD